MLDFAKKMLKKLLIAAFSSPLTQPQQESIVLQPPCLLQFIVHNEVYLIAISLFWGKRKLLNHVNELCVCPR